MIFNYHHSANQILVINESASSNAHTHNLDEWDDYEDIPKEQWNTVQEWEQQFSDRYEFVGNLVKEVIEKEEDSFEKIEETTKED